MNNYTRRLEFRHYDNVLWVLEGQFTEDFVVGFTYGALYSLRELGVPYGYNVSFYANRVTYNMYSPDQLTLRFDNYLISTHTARTMSKELLMRNLRYNHYGQWLAIGDNDDFVWKVAFTSLTFYQGLFTILDAFHIRYTDVVLAQPVKNGQLYQIDNLNLDDPDTAGQIALEYDTEVERERDYELEREFGRDDDETDEQQLEEYNQGFGGYERDY